MEKHDERAIVRETKIHESFLDFSSCWTDAQKSEVFLNRTLLLTAIEKYFLELDQKKNNHGIEFADCHKRAAFTLKWLLRFRPIQFRSIHPPKELIEANEEFAFYTACGFLEINLLDVPKSLRDHCIHHFRNHSYDPESWACTFFLMEACGKRGLFSEISKFLLEKEEYWQAQQKSSD